MQSANPAEVQDTDVEFACFLYFIRHLGNKFVSQHKAFFFLQFGVPNAVSPVLKIKAEQGIMYVFAVVDEITSRAVPGRIHLEAPAQLRRKITVDKERGFPYGVAAIDILGMQHIVVICSVPGIKVESTPEEIYCIYILLTSYIVTVFPCINLRAEESYLSKQFLHVVE